MTKKIKTLALLILTGALTSAFTGCGGSSSGGSGSTPQASATDTPNSSTAELPRGSLADPTFKPQIVDANNTAPQQTVALFLDSLRRGDEATANSMLTSLARAEVQKTDYAIQPPGTPDGEFQIGRLGFPYEDQTVALVESQWREPATQTEPALTMDIVCEVHLEGSAWRIAGMALTVAGESEPLVIDFEDGQRLQQQIRLASGQAAAGPGVGQPLPTGQPAGVTGQPASFTLPALSQPTQSQVGQQPFQSGFQPGTQQPDLNLNNLPPLPSLGGSGTQLATPPNGNPLR